MIGGLVPWSTDFGYDSVGNRTTRSITDPLLTATETYGYDAFSNQLLSSTSTSGENRSIAHTDSGNRATDVTVGPLANKSFTMAYDATDRLTGVSNAGIPLGSYLHNALGQRVSKTVGVTTTHYLYDLGGRLIGEADGVTGATTAEYIALEGMNLAFITTTSIYWIHADHLLTPQVLTDATGAPVWDAAYDPFGAVTVTGTLTFNPRFPGQYKDEETALHYNYFRSYDPSTGRYVESDPIGLGGGWNTYGYVGGNPVSLFDFSGLAVECQIETRMGTEERTESGTIYGRWKLSKDQRDGTDFAGRTADRKYWVLNCAWKRQVTEFVRYLTRQVAITMEICYECGREVSAKPVGNPQPVGPWQIEEHSTSRVQKYIDTVSAALWRGDQAARAFAACKDLSSYPTGVY